MLGGELVLAGHCRVAVHRGRRAGGIKLLARPGVKADRLIAVRLIAVRLLTGGRPAAGGSAAGGQNGRTRTPVPRRQVVRRLRGVRIPSCGAGRIAALALLVAMAASGTPGGIGRRTLVVAAQLLRWPP